MFGEKHIVALFVKCLAVGGGFLVGYFLGGVIAYALDRWVFGKKAPEVVKKLLRLVAGLVVAVLVALFVFGEGGGDGFGGGAGTDGKGKGTPDQTAPSTTPPLPQPAPSPQPGPVGEGEVRVTVLGGADVKAERYYQVGDDPDPKDVDGAMRELTNRKTKDAKLGTVRVVAASRNPLPVTPVAHSAYTRLKAEAEKAGFRVVLP
jgi:hypothetical protein